MLSPPRFWNSTAYLQDRSMVCMKKGDTPGLQVGCFRLGVLFGQIAGALLLGYGNLTTTTIIIIRIVIISQSKNNIESKSNWISDCPTQLESTSHPQNRHESSVYTSPQSYNSCQNQVHLRKFLVEKSQKLCNHPEAFTVPTKTSALRANFGHRLTFCEAAIQLTNTPEFRMEMDEIHLLVNMQNGWLSLLGWKKLDSSLNVLYNISVHVWRVTLSSPNEIYTPFNQHYHREQWKNKVMFETYLRGAMQIGGVITSTQHVSNTASFVSYQLQNVGSELYQLSIMDP